jgi:hypothetical protein
MIAVTFELEGYANWPFLLQVDVAGDGSTTNNIKINTKWLQKKNSNSLYTNGYLTRFFGE